MGVGGMRAELIMKGFDGVRGDMKHLHAVELGLLFFFSPADSSDVWVLCKTACRSQS